NRTRTPLEGAAKGTNSSSRRPGMGLSPLECAQIPRRGKWKPVLPMQSSARRGGKIRAARMERRKWTRFPPDAAWTIKPLGDFREANFDRLQDRVPRAVCGGRDTAAGLTFCCA